MLKKSIYSTPEILDMVFQEGGVICNSQYGAGAIPDVTTEQETSTWEELL